MLDDHTGRLGEFGHQFVGGVGIGDVVVAQLLALQLAGVGDAGATVGRAIEGARLVRVLAVAQGLGEAAGDGFADRGRILDPVGEPGGDCGVIGGGAGKGAGGQLLAQGQRGRAVGLERVNHLIHGVPIDADGDVAVVLGRRADHGRAADVDVLDTGLEARARFNSGFEGVEIDPGDIDRADAVLFHRCGMGGGIADPQQAAVHHGVERLDPAVHHFRKAGQVGDIAHRQPGLVDRSAGAAGGDQLDPQVVKGAGDVLQPRLVRQGDQGTDRANSIRGGRKVRGGGHGQGSVWRARGGGGMAARLAPQGRLRKTGQRSSRGRPRPAGASLRPRPRGGGRSLRFGCPDGATGSSWCPRRRPGRQRPER